MKYTPIGISPEQAQFLETRKFQINEIARIFRVPPHMVGDLEKSSFSNIEQQSLEFVKYTLDPWVVRWEQSIQRSLLSKDEKAVYFVKFNLEGLLRGDYQSRMNGYAIGRQNGWMSANNIRELENLDRIPAEDGSVKDSIINAYEIKTGLSRAKLSHLMDAETWMDANKAVELGFADGIMKRSDETEDMAAPTVSMLYSKANVVNSLMEKIAAKCAIDPKPAVPERTGRSVDELRAKLNTIKNYI